MRRDIPPLQNRSHRKKTHDPYCVNIVGKKKKSLIEKKNPDWDIRETVTFLDPGFHETTQEEFDGDIKDRPTSLKDIKKMGGSIIVGR